MNDVNLRRFAASVGVTLLAFVANVKAQVPPTTTPSAPATTASQLQLMPQSVILRDSEGALKPRTVYTTDGPAFLKAVLPALPQPNSSIVNLMLSYPTSGEHDYWWPKGGGYDGSTTDVLLNGKVVMKGEPEGRTFCCGLTLEVFYKYAASNPALGAKVAADPDVFKKDWFCRQINSPGPLDAFQAAGVGKAVTDPENAIPGDFVQLWRNDKSGHSVIFVNWLRDETGKRVGLQYWSTQTSTKGIGFQSEAFGTGPKQMIENKLSVSRPTL